MSDKQSEAQRLAAALEADFWEGVGDPEILAAAELRRLDAENATLRASLTASPATVQDKLDAERYRWLRDGELDGQYPFPVMRTGLEETDFTLWAEELDAAIDAAMKGHKP